MQAIITALVKAQKAFEPARKGSDNPHFRSKYAALDACVDAVLTALNDNGVYLMQKTHDCEDGVKVETVFLHESGGTLSGGTLHVPAAKLDPQGYGSALTYARRYSLLAACGIAPEDDDGNQATAAYKAKSAVPAASAKHDKQADEYKRVLASINNAEDLDALHRAADEINNIDIPIKGKDALREVYNNRVAAYTEAAFHAPKP